MKSQESKSRKLDCKEATHVAVDVAAAQTASVCIVKRRRGKTNVKLTIHHTLNGEHTVTEHDRFSNFRRRSDFGEKSQRENDARLSRMTRIICVSKQLWLAVK